MRRCILTVSPGAGCTDTAGLHLPPQLKPASRKKKRKKLREERELFNLERSQRHHLSFQALDGKDGDLRYISSVSAPVQTGGAPALIC